jgi:acyl-CoA hydrolase
MTPIVMETGVYSINLTVLQMPNDNTKELLSEWTSIMDIENVELLDKGIVVSNGQVIPTL